MPCLDLRDKVLWDPIFSTKFIHTGSEMTYIIGRPVPNEVGGNRAEKLSKDRSVPLCSSVDQTESRIGDGICDKIVLLAAGLVLVGVRSGPHERGNLGVRRAAVLGRNQAKVLYRCPGQYTNISDECKQRKDAPLKSLRRKVAAKRETGYGSPSIVELIMSSSSTTRQISESPSP